MAFAEEFPTKFFLARQVRKVLCRENGLLVAQERVARHGIALLGAQDQPDRRLITIATAFGLPVSNVEVHLADVGVVEWPSLQVDEDEALQDIMVEDKIDAVVHPVDRDPLLPGYEAEATPEFQRNAWS